MTVDGEDHRHADNPWRAGIVARMIGFLKSVPDVDIAFAKLPAALGIRDAARAVQADFDSARGANAPPRKCRLVRLSRFPLSKLFMVRILPYNPRNTRSSNRDHERQANEAGRRENPCVTSRLRP
jgi:hypothetical protein